MGYIFRREGEMKKLLIAILIVLFTILAPARRWAEVGPRKGALVIVGGGKIPPSIREKFIALAGSSDASFVYIPTAAEDQELNRRGDGSSRLFGLKNVAVLHKL
jgi:cyanophycinase